MQTTDRRIEGTAYEISMAQDRLDLALVTTFLSGESYWAAGRPADVIARSIVGSDVFGVYDGAGEQAGFARLVTDRATFGWVCDVFVLPAHRSLGLGKALLDAVTDHADELGITRLMLATADAHDLYDQFGFAPLAAPARWMERKLEVS